MIEIDNISKKYFTKKNEIVALEHINLKFENKGFVFILGKSGSGKTTLLNLIGGLDSADSGNIWVDFIRDKERTDVLKLSDKQMDRYHNLYMGFIFQEDYLIDNWSVKDNIFIALEQQNHNLNFKEIENKINDTLRYVELENVADRIPSELSGGQAQRVSIARALVKKPKVILADEPTGNLDSKSSKVIFELLQKISKECLVVVVTHDESAAAEYGDRIIRIKDGQIVSDIRNKDSKNEYKIVITDYNNKTEHILIEKNVRKIQEFLYEKVINRKISNQYHIDFCMNESQVIEEEQQNEIETAEAKNISLKSILRFAVNNLKKRKMRLAITIVIFTITLVFLQVIGEVCVARVGRPMSEYLTDRNVDSIYLKTDIIYQNEFYEECNITKGNTNIIKETMNHNWDKAKISGCISDVEVVYQNEMVSVMLCTRKSGELLKGTYPSKDNEICLTDFCARMLGLQENCIGNEIKLYGKGFTISGIIDTDYEESNIIQKINKNITNEYEQYKMVHQYLKIICADKFLSYLSQEADYLNISSSNFMVNGSQAYLASNLRYASVDNINVRDELTLGRYPAKEDEILVSYDFAEKYGLLDDAGFISGKEYTYQNIWDKSYNGAYEGNLNIYDILRNVRVVGIVQSHNNYNIDIWLNGEIYKTLKNNYYSDSLYNLYEINIGGESKKQVENEMNIVYSRGIYVEEPCMSRILQVYEARNKIIKIGITLGIVFIILTVLLNISFFSYNVSDNQEKIGVLKALGVNRKSVVMIFAFEAIFVSIISYSLSYIIGVGTLNQINRFLQNDVTVQIIFFFKNYEVQLLIFLFSIILGVLSVVLPVLNLSKEKPIKLLKKME